MGTKKVEEKKPKKTPAKPKKKMESPVQTRGLASPPGMDD